MLSSTILKPLVLGIPKVTFFVRGSACKDVNLVLKLIGLTEPSVGNDLETR